IREQGQKGKWDYQLKSVYTIGILDFVFDDDYSTEDFYHHEVKLIDTLSGKVFYDKLTFIYLEMPKYLKQESELVTMFDKWMFVLRNLTSLMNRPAALQERIFERVFRVAEIAQFTPVERSEYEESLKVLRDLTNVIDTAALRGYEKGREEGMEKGMEKGRKEGREEGMEKGREEEKIATARSLKSLNVPLSTIMQATGLSIEEIEQL
ncbi:MAG: PD-(D/E)XK nuclease family transposase, partial [Bacteroides sp.]